MSLFKGQWGSLWHKGYAVTAMRALMGDPRLLIDGFDIPTAAFTDASGSGHTVTPISLLSSDQTLKGLGKVYDYSNDVEARLTVADSDEFSFGDGATDSPFTIGALIQVQLSAGHQAIMTKWDGSTVREWNLFLRDDERLAFYIMDESTDKFPYVWSSVLSTGWHYVCATYSAASGGNTAANDMTLYVDGVSSVSTRVNSIGYVAMENLTTGVLQGLRPNGAAWQYPFQGQLGLTFIDGTCWTQAQVTSNYDMIKDFYRL